MKKVNSIRIFLYFLGMVILAFGISLNARTSLGVAPIVSIAYCISSITGQNFGNMTFLVYSMLVIIEVIIHLSRKMYKAIGKDMLQILVSIIFTRFLNVFNAVIPDLGSESMRDTWAGSMMGRIMFLIVAIICTGIGAALSMNMRLIPNPGDGIVQTIGDASKKDNGLVKNCLDVTCVLTTCLIGLIFKRTIIGIGIGTLMAMIGVGRVIAVFNHFTLEKTKSILN